MAEPVRLETIDHDDAMDDVADAVKAILQANAGVNIGDVVARDYFVEIARGNVSGLSTYNKFGRNIEIDASATSDIWDGGHTLASSGVSLLWVAPTAAAVHNIKSSSSSDDGDPGGVGARTVRLFGLTDWDTKEVSEDITLNGTDDVATSNSYVIIHRMHVLTKGATNVNVGVITATATAPSTTTITAQIRVGQGQTQMAILGVPSTQKAYMGRFYGNINKAGGVSGLVDVALLVNIDPDVELLNFLVRHTFALEKGGSSAFTIPFYVPKIIDGPAIIKVQVASGTNDMDVSGGFDLVLVDN